MEYIIFADIHANLAALEAVLDHEKSWDEVIFLGDAVVAGPHPDEVLSILSELDGAFIMGNHDREVFRVDLNADGGGHRSWAQWTREHISSKNLQFMKECFSESCVIQRDGLTIRLHHGNFRFESGSRLWPDSSKDDFETVTNDYREKFLFHAHSHIQFLMDYSNTKILNPGSMGHTRLGQPLSCYAVLKDGEIELRAVPYDVEKTCRAMDDLPLDRDFIEDWKTSFRTGTLAPRYNIRDFAPLREMGYR